MATASTMIPIPPSQLNSCRHRFKEGESLSKPVRTVAPVVDNPDMVSKYASVNERLSMPSNKGNVANAGMAVHMPTTNKYPCRIDNSPLYFLVNIHINTPQQKVHIMASMKSQSMVYSALISAQTIGITYEKLNTTSSNPSACITLSVRPI